MIAGFQGKQLLVDPHNLLKRAETEFGQKQLNPTDEAAYLLFVQMRFTSNLDQHSGRITGDNACGGFNCDPQALQIHDRLGSCHNCLMEGQQFN